MKINTLCALTFLFFSVSQFVCIHGFEVDILSYLKEFEKHGQILLEKVNKGEPIHANCGNFLQDLRKASDGCMEPKYADGCRHWWFGYRHLVAASRKFGGQILIPNYVQYLNELKEHLEHSPYYTSDKMRQWLHDYLGVGDGSDSAFAGADFIPGSRSGGGNDSEIALIFNELPAKGTGETLSHLAIFVYGTVIDLEGPKGIYIDDKKGYEAVIDERKQKRTEKQLYMNMLPTLSHVQQILDVLTAGKFAPGKFNLLSNDHNCYGFARTLLTKMVGEEMANHALDGLKPTPEILEARLAYINLMNIQKKKITFDGGF